MRCTQHGGPRAGEEPWHWVIGVAIEKEKGTEANQGAKGFLSSLGRFVPVSLLLS